jgi:MYXO-CTERM domain-containing protein
MLRQWISSGPLLSITILASVMIIALASTPTTAWAGEPDEVEAEPPTPLVFQGALVSPCGWPTAVAVTSGGGLCSGTLVHPRVVINAAHCGGGNKTIRFSEDAFGGGQPIGASCQTNPGYDQSQGTDWAYCVLDEAVDNIPITPVLFGCELDMLVAGMEVAVVGFGKNTPNGGSGTKRWGLTTLEGVSLATNTTALGGGDEPSVCPGDSGGPAFVQGLDGIWRVFGIASTVNIVNGQDCGGLATHSLVAGAVPWIEESSGFDITPCHDQDGTWNPGPDCTGFFGSANNTYGNWGNWCAGTPASPPPATCGPALGTPAEDNPPSVSITSPADDFVSNEIPTIVDIQMNASDDSGFVTAWLRINGEDALNVTVSEAPFLISGVTFPEGSYEIVGVAEDYWGNQGVSAPLNVVVDPNASDSGDGDGDPGGDGDGDPGDGDGGSSGTSGGPGLDGGFDGGFDDGGGSDGCACRTSGAGGGAPAGVAVLGLFALGWVRRRRS